MSIRADKARVVCCFLFALKPEFSVEMWGNMAGNMSHHAAANHGCYLTSLSCNRIIFQTRLTAPDTKVRTQLVADNKSKKHTL